MYFEKIKCYLLFHIWNNYKKIQPLVCGGFLFAWRNRVEIGRKIDQDAFISSEGKVSQLNEVSMYANWLIRKLLVNMY